MVPCHREGMAGCGMESLPSPCRRPLRYCLCHVCYPHGDWLLVALEGALKPDSLVEAL